MSQVCKIKVMIQNNTSILGYASGDFAPSLIFIFLYGCQCYKMNICSMEEDPNQNEL